jgi:hypothetical protein
LRGCDRLDGTPGHGKVYRILLDAAQFLSISQNELMDALAELSRDSGSLGLHALFTRNPDASLNELHG